MLDNIPLILFAVPLIIAFSLVYQGTRNEEILQILRRSLRTMGMVAFFMFVMLVLLGLLLGRSLF